MDLFLFRVYVCDVSASPAGPHIRPMFQLASKDLHADSEHQMEKPSTHQMMVELTVFVLVWICRLSYCQWSQWTSRHSRQRQGMLHLQ
jgi:hypothetical protein